MDTNAKLGRIASKLDAGERLKIILIGLGSVGNYLLSYLLSAADENLEIVVVGRNAEKMQSDVNIAQVASLIRGECRSHVHVVGGVNLDDVESIAACLQDHDPDIIVNSSRAYAGLKYGSISWNAIRAYGIWTPLSIRYIRNIMLAHDAAASHALVINTSYSDATIPWLKSAGKAYPDFGSGNLNHIVPRLQLGAAELAGIDDFWNIDVELATAHFHDVVISKEGQDEGVAQLLRVSYGGAQLQLDYDALLARCAIPMPVDQKRNMMNASSNYRIIRAILDAIREKRAERFFSPGAFGEIGGYPVVVDGAGGATRCFIDESSFALDDMRAKNRASIALDGVEDVRDGVLTYTDDLIRKVESAFGVELPKHVGYGEIDDVADFIVGKIIEPELVRRSR